MKHQLLIFSLLFSTLVFGQQLPNFGLYHEYQSYLNPAALPHDYFKEDQNAQVGLSLRNQWNRFGDGSPTTGFIHGTYVGDQSNTKLIIGGSLLVDKAGPINLISANAKFGVLFSDDPLYGGFSAALTIGYKQQSIRADQLHANYNNKSIGEILAAGENFKAGSPDIGLGIFYHARLQNEDNFYTGLSMPQFFSVNGITPNNKANIKAIPHYYGMIGYIKYLNDYSFLEPSAIVRYAQNIPVHVDLSLKYQLDQTLWLGVGASSSKVVHMEAGIVLGENIGLSSPFRISYSYEDGFNELAAPFGNTHEISLSYAWDTRR